MPKTIQDNRWTADPQQFAASVHLDDVAGFFSKQLLVEPGTRALIVDEGRYLGDVGPGTYTLASFADRLTFWRRKQATAILVRQEDFPLEIFFSGLPTAENLMVDATVRLAVQIEDAALLARNLMGTRKEFRAADLQAALFPLVEQALWQAVGKLSITELTGPENQAAIDAAVEQALAMSMRRYGLRFAQVQVVSIHHERYDEQRRKLGEVWLRRQQHELQQGLDQLYSEEELQKIKRFQSGSQLAALAENAAIDRQESELAAKLRRIGLRNRLRAAVLSEEFDKVKNEEELARFLHERDKDGLLRGEEMAQLLEGYQQRKDDRASARKHLAAKLEVERQMEVEQVREQLDHAMKMKRLEHEIELARRTASKENVTWQQAVERECREAEHRRQLRDKELKQQNDWARQHGSFRREDQWEELVHQQRVDRLRGEMEVESAERKLRAGRIESELKTSLAVDQLELDKRRKEWELEFAHKENASQFERLAGVQRLNDESASRQLDLLERRQRLEAELAMLKEDKAYGHEIGRLHTMAKMSAEAMIALAAEKNAALLADFKKHEATQQSLIAQAALGHRPAEPAPPPVARPEAERLKADAVAAAYRAAMQAQQQPAERNETAPRGAAPKPGVPPAPPPQPPLGSRPQSPPPLSQPRPSAPEWSDPPVPAWREPGSMERPLAGTPNPFRPVTEPAQGSSSPFRPIGSAQADQRPQPAERSPQAPPAPPEGRLPPRAAADTPSPFRPIAEPPRQETGSPFRPIGDEAGHGTPSPFRSIAEHPEQRYPSPFRPLGEPVQPVGAANAGDKVPVSEPARFIVCPSCQAKNIETARQCSACGSAL